MAEIIMAGAIGARISTVAPNGGFAGYTLRVQRTCENVIIRATHETREISQSLVPVLSGDLRASCRVRFDRINGAIVPAGVVSYHTPYAHRIHEDLNIRHPIHHHHGREYNCGGGAKYLENAARQVQPEMGRALRRALHP